MQIEAVAIFSMIVICRSLFEYLVYLCFVKENILLLLNGHKCLPNYVEY